MITVDTLKTLTTFTAPALTRSAQLAGYKGPDFTSCKFIGISNGGQFCYTVDFHHTMDRVFADVQLTHRA